MDSGNQDNQWNPSDANKAANGTGAAGSGGEGPANAGSDQHINIKVKSQVSFSLRNFYSYWILAYSRNHS